MDHLVILREQFVNDAFKIAIDKESLLVHGATKAVHGNSDSPCFFVHDQNESRFIQTNYYVGVDWIKVNELAVLVESKLNTNQNTTDEVDVLGMLFASLKYTENIQHLDGLLHIEYDGHWIEIPEESDVLSPVLIVQFLSVVKKIVRKGLKKDYYRVTQNLRNRVKGKILVGDQIRQNVFKNKLTHTVCNYQEYGVNHPENQFLKLVLGFVHAFIQTNEQLFLGYTNEIRELLSYIEPGFAGVETAPKGTKTVRLKRNSFYSEYTKAIELGEAILKQLGFNVTKTENERTVFTPPFWIDMSKLFELYVFGKLKEIFPNQEDLSYHDTFYSKETDILIKETKDRCVVDCKYKPQYRNGSIELPDKRQVLGYTRLTRVYDLLKVPKNEVIRGLIIYPDQTAESAIKKEELFFKEISEYVAFYKLGIRLPVKGVF